MTIDAPIEKVFQFVEDPSNFPEEIRVYHLHVSLNFHRAPGYCINDGDREPFLLWKDKLAQDAFVHHWEVFARRYKGIPSSALSFNLVNEAPSPRSSIKSG